MDSISVCNSTHKSKYYYYFFLFDIDYTLARYKPALHTLIYDNAKKFLVKNFRVMFIIFSSRALKKNFSLFTLKVSR